jgi:hypothetical protein
MENVVDTTEQINGYYFDGKSNLSESELLFWLLMDESYKQFGDYNQAYQLQHDLTGIRDEIINNREFFLRDIDHIFKFQK